MSNKTKEEKLQILHNRLDEINEKQAQARNNKKNIEVREEDFSKNIPTSNKKNNKLKTYLIRVLIIVGVFLILKNLNLNSIDFKGFLSEKEDAKTDNVNDKQEDTNIIYNLNSKGVSYILTGEYDSEEQAIQETDKIKSILGNIDFEISYKFIPNISNSNFQIYKTLIGPFSLESEAKQWNKNIGEKSEIINL